MTDSECWKKFTSSDGTPHSKENSFDDGPAEDWKEIQYNFSHF